MTSREFAELMRKQAAELDTLPEFPVPSYLERHGESIAYYYSKDEFVAAVRALRMGTKEIVGDKLQFHPRGATFHLEIERDSMCKKVREAEWKCEPLFSGDEAAVVEAASTGQEIPF